MVVTALVDEDLNNEEREEMAKVLFNTPRDFNIQMGKPVFPVLKRNVGNTRPVMSSFIGSNSWLLFDLLQLNDVQEWLLEPCETWITYPAYQKLSNFVRNMVCTNDGAERSMHLIDEYIDKVRDEMLSPNLTKFFGPQNKTEMS